MGPLLKAGCPVVLLSYCTSRSMSLCGCRMEETKQSFETKKRDKCLSVKLWCYFTKNCASIFFLKMSSNFKNKAFAWQEFEEKKYIAAYSELPKYRLFGIFGMWFSRFSTCHWGYQLFPLKDQFCLIFTGKDEVFHGLLSTICRLGKQCQLHQAIFSLQNSCRKRMKY